MSRSDQWINVALVLAIVLHVAVLAVGYYVNRLLVLSASMNLVVGVSLILSWGIKQLRVQQHTIEAREILVLGLEVLVIGSAVYTLVTGIAVGWLRVTQYTFFGVHLILLILGLLFMLTFKITRLI